MGETGKLNIDPVHLCQFRSSERRSNLSLSTSFAPLVRQPTRPPIGASPTAGRQQGPT